MAYSLSNAATAQALAFGSAVAVALLTTDVLRKPGRRMERLHELAEMLPEGDPVRLEFEAEVLREAKKLASRLVNRPPRLVRISGVALVVWLYYVLLGSALKFAGDHGLIKRFLTSWTFNLGRLAGQQQRATPGVSWKVFLVADLVNDVAAGIGVTAGLILLAWSLRRWLTNRRSS